ncbi:MAG: glycosyltransferase family 4 protein [Clostridium sp.]|nr:glycosyltransferase family 4 protein [Clostridium sp.]
MMFKADNKFQYVIFGTGKGGKKVYELIQGFHHIQVACFLDNFPKTKTFCELPVIKATDFLENEDFLQYIYIVASVYREEIIKQLLPYGIPIIQIWGKADIVYNNWSVYEEEIKLNSGICDAGIKNRTIIFDCGGGFVLGGVENWSYNLAREFLKRNQKVKLLSNNLKKSPPDDLKDCAVYTVKTDDFTDYKFLSIQEIVNILSIYMPCTIFVAHVDNLLFAAYILKQRYPNDIKIISVIHGGLHRILRDNVAVESMLDLIFCVSIDAQKALVQQYNLDRDKVLFKETPVDVCNIEKRQYNLDRNNPIYIGYATRLEKTHKHAELIIPLIEELEERNINYILDIAGLGKLFNDIQNFILENNLKSKVHLLGIVDYEQMPQFWLSHDIAINLSECEGCCMAMLESMAAAVVPIFTDVFSTRHFIHDSVNGFVVEYGNIKQMAGKIEYLEEHREELENMGIKAHSEVKVKCKMDRYMDYIQDKISDIDG